MDLMAIEELNTCLWQTELCKFESLKSHRRAQLELCNQIKNNSAIISVPFRVLILGIMPLSLKGWENSSCAPVDQFESITHSSLKGRSGHLGLQLVPGQSGLCSAGPFPRASGCCALRKEVGLLKVLKVLWAFSIFLLSLLLLKSSLPNLPQLLEFHNRCIIHF